MDLYSVALSLDPTQLITNSARSERALIGVGTAAEGSQRKLTTSAQVMSNSLARVERDAERASAGFGTMATSMRNAAMAMGVMVSAAGALNSTLGGAMKLEKQMAMVATVADTTTVSLGDLQNGVTNLFSSLPVQSMDELTTGLYDIISSGISAGESLRFLDISARAAIAGATSTAVAVDGLTTAVNAWRGMNLEAGEAADMMFMAVNKGKMTFDQLASSIGTIAPVAAGYKISMEDVLGSAAQLTLSGLTASEAMVGIRSAIVNIINPTGELAKTLPNVAKEFNATKLEAVGFTEFLRQFNERVGGSKEAINALFSDVQGKTAVFSLLSDGGKAAAAQVENVAKASGSMNTAFDLATKTTDALAQLVRNRLGAAFTELGTRQLPFVHQMLTVVANAMGDAGQAATLLSNTMIVLGTGAAVKWLAPALAAMATYIQAQRAAIAQRTLEEAAARRSAASALTAAQSVENEARATLRLAEAKAADVAATQRALIAERTLQAERLKSAAMAMNQASFKTPLQSLAPLGGAAVAAEAERRAAVQRQYNAALAESARLGAMSVGVEQNLASASRQVAVAKSGVTAATGNAARAMATYSGAATTATLASRAATGAMGLLRSAMAFLGGPWGVAITAIGAAYLYMSNQASKAAEEVQKVNNALEGKTVEQLRGMEEFQRKHVDALRDAVINYRKGQGEHISDLQEKLRDAIKLLEQLEVARQKAERAALGTGVTTTATAPGQNPPKPSSGDAEAEEARRKRIVDQINAEAGALSELQNARAQATLRLAQEREQAQATGAGLEYLRIQHQAEMDTLVAQQSLQGAALAVRLDTIEHVRSESQATAELVRQKQQLAGASSVLAKIEADAAAKRRSEMDATAAKIETKAEELQNLTRQMQETMAEGFKSIFTDGLDGFQNFFKRILDMFLKLVADMLAASAMKKVAGVMTGLLGNLAPKTAGAQPTGDAATAASGVGGLAYGGAALAGAGVGYGLGQSVYNATGSKTAGALSGAAGGAAAGFAIAGPWGAAAGAVAGFVGGIIGAGKAAREAAKQMEELQTAFRNNMAAMRAAIAGDTIAEGVARIKSEMESLRKQANESLAGKKNESERNRALAEINRMEAQRIAQLREQALIVQQTMREDYAVRMLVAQGRDAEAAAMRFQLDQQREMQKLIKENADPATIALLEQVQAEERLRFATDQAKLAEDKLAAARDEAARKAEEAARRAEDLTVRFLQSTGRGAQAADAERAAMQRRELADAKANKLSPTEVAAIELVHIAENAAAKRAAEAATQIATIRAQHEAQMQIFNEQLSTAKSQLEAARETERQLTAQVSTLRKLVDALHDFRTGMRVGAASPLDMGAQLEEARNQMNSAFALAQGGDADAAAQIPALAQRFLELSKQFNGSNAAYANDFFAVEAMVKLLEEQYGAELSVAEQQLAEAKKQTELLEKQIAQLEEAMERARADMEAQIAAIEAAAASEATKMDDVIKALEATRTASVGPAEKLIERLEVLRESLTGQAATINETQIKALGENRDAVNAAVAAEVEAIKNGASLQEIATLHAVAKLEMQRLDQNTKAVEQIEYLRKMGVLSDDQLAKLEALRAEQDSLMQAQIAAIQGIDITPIVNVPPTIVNIPPAPPPIINVHVNPGGDEGSTYTPPPATPGGTTQPILPGEEDTISRDLERVYGYAIGGMHPGGLRLVGEEGPELEVTGPSRIFSAADTAALLKGGTGTDEETKDELRAQTRELKAIVTQLGVGLSRVVERLDQTNEGVATVARETRRAGSKV